MMSFYIVTSYYTKCAKVFFPIAVPNFMSVLNIAECHSPYRSGALLVPAVLLRGGVLYRVESITEDLCEEDGNVEWCEELSVE